MDVNPAAEGRASAQPASQPADPGMAPDAQPINFSLPGRQHERAGAHASNPQQAAGPLSNVFDGSTDDDPGQGTEA